jgi:hypothetical protein
MLRKYIVNINEHIVNQSMFFLGKSTAYGTALRSSAPHGASLTPRR